MEVPQSSTVHRTRFVVASFHICSVRSASRSVAGTEHSALPASRTPFTSASVRRVVCVHIHHVKRSGIIRPAVLTAHRTTAVHCRNTQHGTRRHSVTAIAQAASESAQHHLRSGCCIFHTETLTRQFFQPAPLVEHDSTTLPTSCGACHEAVGDVQRAYGIAVKVRSTCASGWRCSLTATTCG